MNSKQIIFTTTAILLFTSGAYADKALSKTQILNILMQSSHPAKSMKKVTSKTTKKRYAKQTKKKNTKASKILPEDNAENIRSSMEESGLILPIEEKPKSPKILYGNLPSGSLPNMTMKDHYVMGQRLDRRYDKILGIERPQIVRANTEKRERKINPLDAIY